MPSKANDQGNTKHKIRFSLYGCPDDLGVTLNRGRSGAKEGPNAIRSFLYKMCPPLKWQSHNHKLVDFGNIVTQSDILANHKRAFTVSKHLARDSVVIALGGGHDYATPNILGWLSGAMECHSPPPSKRKKINVGIINVDPHLDVRELENNLPHSGTPFRQILESGKITGSNLVQFGAREGRNAKSHFDYCTKNKVRMCLLESILKKSSPALAFKNELIRLEKLCTDVAVTIDMDSCSELEGVSAAPVLGFRAWDLCQFAYLAGQSKKVRFLEIAEVAPSLDPTGRSARVAAEVIFYFLKGKVSS
jgi:formimidoylglutamase